MRTLRRELAAGRPTDSGTGLIDFLGIDDDGRLHVIETKIGHRDHCLGLQGLDYWAWATAHAHELRTALKADGHVEVADQGDMTLRYVIGEKPPRLIHGAARATIASLHPDIRWRVQVLGNWNVLAKDHRPLSLVKDIGMQRDLELPGENR
jgi:hypothetical protein